MHETKHSTVFKVNNKGDRMMSMTSLSYKSILFIVDFEYTLACWAPYLLFSRCLMLNGA